MKHGLARLLLSFDSKENHEFVCGISHILYDFTPRRQESPTQRNPVPLAARGG
jgi:hypothetical protein